MNSKGLGYLLFAAAAALGWLWWRRRNDPAVVAEGQTDGLAGLKQVGSNFQEDSSAEVVKAALDTAAQLVRTSGPCWEQLPDPHFVGSTYWRLSDGSAQTRLPFGQSPTSHHIC